MVSRSTSTQYSDLIFYSGGVYPSVGFQPSLLDYPGCKLYCGSSMRDYHFPHNSGALGWSYQEMRSGNCYVQHAYHGAAQAVMVFK